MSESRREEVADDAQLVSRCRQGELDAFEGLVERYQKRMLTVAYRMTGSYEDACEIVQDAFVAAYGNIGRFEERSRFSTWLYTIVVNRTRNFLERPAVRSGRRELSLDETVRSEEGGVRLDLPTEEPSALDVMVRRETQEQVQRCISALQAEFREVLVLRDLQGLSYGEVASLLGLAEGSVKSRIFRARESVKNCLKRLLGRA